MVLGLPFGDVLAHVHARGKRSSGAADTRATCWQQCQCRRATGHCWGDHSPDQERSHDERHSCGHQPRNEPGQAEVLSPPREPLVGSRGRPPTWWSPPPIYTTPADASFESQPDQRAAGSSRASRPRPEDATSTSSRPHTPSIRPLSSPLSPHSTWLRDRAVHGTANWNTFRVTQLAARAVFGAAREEAREVSA